MRDRGKRSDDRYVSDEFMISMAFKIRGRALRDRSFL